MKFEESRGLTPRQKRFAEEYLIDCNGAQAAIRAGYSEKTARQAAWRLMSNAEVRGYIEEQLKGLHSERIADAGEVLAFLTEIMRGEAKEPVILRVGGNQVAEMVAVSTRERIKAAELIGKRYALFSESGEQKGENIVICGEEEL